MCIPEGVSRAWHAPAVASGRARLDRGARDPSDLFRACPGIAFVSVRKALISATDGVRFGDRHTIYCGFGGFPKGLFVLLRHKRILIILKGWHGALTAWASWHESREGQGEPEPQGRDRVGNVPFRPCRRGSVGPDLRKRQGPGRSGLQGLLGGRGKPPARRPGNHGRRCTEPRGDGLRAIPALCRDRVPVLVGGPEHPARSASAWWAVSTKSAIGVSSGRVDSQKLVGSLASGGHSMSSHSSGRASPRRASPWAGRTRTAAKRASLSPSVQARSIANPIMQRGFFTL